jgi:hypothetical protein
MTLQVGVYYFDKVTGEELDVDLGPGGDVFGYESSRIELWGAKTWFGSATHSW